MKDLAVIIAENAVTDLKAPTTDQGAVELAHERIRALARVYTIDTLLAEWKAVGGR